MSDFNSVVLVGRLTRDPELRYTQVGTEVCDIGLAVNNERGKVKETCFIEVTFWGKLAQIVSTHLSKGRQILVSGRLRQEVWQDKDGNKRSRLGVVANDFQFLDGPKPNNAPTQTMDESSSNPEPTPRVSNDESSSNPEPTPGVSNVKGGIPF